MLFFMLLSLVMVLVVYFIFFLMSYKTMIDFESNSVYECGFDISSGTRVGFSYRFFLVAVLFLIFDVEIVLMLPSPLMLSGFPFLLFIIILILGLLYEYHCGSLEWL